MESVIRARVLISFVLVFVSLPLFAATVFRDSFDSSPSPLWANERGSWAAGNGGYYAQCPSNSPTTFTSLPLNLKDFSVELDVNGISDGGVWLRSSFTGGAASGVLLVTGGKQRSGTGFYWHIVHNDGYSPMLHDSGALFSQGDNVHIRIDVTGNTYCAYLNGSSVPATTLTTEDFPSGSVGLYDFSSQRFDNFTLSVAAPTVGMRNRSCHESIMDSARDKYLFAVWGKAYPFDQNSFVLDDGSGAPVKVFAPGYSGFVSGRMIRASGALATAPEQSTIVTVPALVSPLE